MRLGAFLLPFLSFSSYGFTFTREWRAAALRAAAASAAELSTPDPVEVRWEDNHLVYRPARNREASRFSIGDTVNVYSELTQQVRYALVLHSRYKCSAKNPVTDALPYSTGV